MVSEEALSALCLQPTNTRFGNVVLNKGGPGDIEGEGRLKPSEAQLDIWYGLTLRDK